MSDLRSLLPKELPESTLRSADLKDGRVVALAAVKAGDAVFSEKPYAISPMLKKGSPSCFGCCRVVSRPWPCGGCGVPLCCAACASSPFHREECLLMQRCGFRFQDLSGIDIPASEIAKALDHQQLCIVALRLLLLGEDSGWRSLDRVYDAARIKRTTPVLREIFGSFWPPLLAFDLKSAVDAWLIANHNRTGFDRKLKGRSGVCVVRINPRVGHSCVANSSFHFWMPDLDDRDPSSMTTLRIVFSATRDVAAGDEVTRDIGCPLQSNAGRHFQATQKGPGPEGWLCRCRRCKDGTDFGLFLGSPCCVACKDRGVQSLLVPRAPRGGKSGRQQPQQPPDMSWLEWSCRTCKKQPTRRADQERLAALTSKCMDIAGRLDVLDDEDGEDDPMELERLLQEQLYPRGLMHPTFVIALTVKCRLSTEVLLGRKGDLDASRIYRMPADLLQRLEGHCRDVLAVMETLQVGLNWKRGYALLGFSLLLRVKAQRAVAARTPPTDETMATLAESERALRTALQCLRWRRHFWPALLKEVDALEHTKAVMGWLRLLSSRDNVTG